MTQEIVHERSTFGSAFAGIGGFELGLERAGWECKWQIENDKFCNEILGERWPNVKRYGDIEDVEAEGLDPVDLVCGGFPCQDLSVAGKRGGLAGERSGLFWELVRVIQGVRPKWILVENVPGFLSSNEGEDFALALQTLAECGYGLAWRVLDSQHFGVPQRRRRVYIVGHLGAMCPPEILFESEGGEGDIAEGGEAGEDVAYRLRERPSHGGDKGDGGINTVLIYGSSKPGIAPTLRSPDPNAPRGPDGKRRDGGPGEKIPIIAGFFAKATSRSGDGEEVDPDGVREAPGVSRRVDYPDGSRYKTLGNAVTVQVAEWIGRRILEYGERHRKELAF